MATASIYYNNPKPVKKKLFPLVFVIRHKSRHTHIPSGIKLEHIYWDDKRMIKKGAPNIVDTLHENAQLLKKLADIQAYITALTNSGEIDELSALQIKKKYLSKSLKEKSTFSSYLNDFTKTKSKGTANLYTNTADRLNDFSPNEVYFSEINPKFLRDFETYLKKRNNAVNTIAIHMRNIRAIFNAAINDEIIELNLYPFRKYKIKTEKTIKRNLTINEIRTLRDVELFGVPQLSRDIFMLIFYLSGINLKDLSYLTKANIINERLEYQRFKGGKNYSIKIEPEANRLFKKLKGTKYLINLIERYQSYDSVKKEINKKLKIAAAVAKIKAPVSTYYARHSVATIAKNIGIPTDDIKAILGHADNTITDIYIDLDQNIKDKALRKILNRLK